MPFLSRLRLKKNDKDPARSQSGVVEAVQNEGTSARTGTKVCCFYIVFLTIWMITYSNFLSPVEMILAYLDLAIPGGRMITLSS